MNEVNTDPDRLEKKRQAESYWSDRVPDMPGPPRLEALRTVRTNDDFGRIETDLPPELFSRICERCEGLPEKVFPVLPSGVVNGGIRAAWDGGIRGGAAPAGA